MINFLRRLLAFSALLIALFLSAAPAVVASSATQASPTEVLAQPYIEIEEAEAEEDVPQWTYRFLVPTVVALTVVLIAGTVVMYFVKVVRGRYAVVE